MKNAKLTKKQSTAVLVTIYHELDSIFSSLNRFKGLKDKEERRERILEDLAHVITKDLKYQDLESAEVLDLFKV